MSDYGLEFSDLASELVAEFSEELGVATLRRLTGQTRDVDAGTIIPTYTDYQALMVFDEIESSIQDEYTKEHQLVIIAGSDIATVPDEGDLIVKQDGVSHKIVAVMVDQYEASFICHIQRKPA